MQRRGGRGRAADGADDADVALTLEFNHGALVVHDGIWGRPDAAVRGTADAIMAMSNIPLTKRGAFPLPTDRPSYEVLREMVRAMRAGELRVHGMLTHFGLLSRLTVVMSVNG